MPRRGQTNRQSLDQRTTLENRKISRRQGGRARLIHIDASVREFILNIPAFRKLPAFYQAEEAFAEYANAAHSHAYRQIIDAVENMSAQEQEKLALFLSREGIRGFLTRLGINEAD